MQLTIKIFLTMAFAIYTVVTYTIAVSVVTMCNFTERLVKGNGKIPVGVLPPLAKLDKSANSASLHMAFAFVVAAVAVPLIWVYL